MSKRARESWLSDDVPDHFADAMLLCQGGGVCGQDGRCSLEGFCFRGLGSAEVRRGLEVRLDAIENDLRELMVACVPQRQEAARRLLGLRADEVRGVILQFDRERTRERAND